MIEYYYYYIYFTLIAGSTFFTTVISIDHNIQGSVGPHIWVHKPCNWYSKRIVVKKKKTTKYKSNGTPKRYPDIKCTPAINQSSISTVNFTRYK